MTEEEKTKYCSNCESNIPISKYILHERMCSINVKKCPICKKPITVEDIEDHNKEFHFELECEYCQKKFTKDKLEQHKKICDYKMTECQYCEMQIPIREKKNHEHICGSKTEECHICKKFIMKKDWNNHKMIGCKPPVQNVIEKKDNEEFYIDKYNERENRKRLQEIEEKNRLVQNNNINHFINNNNNNRNKVQNSLPIQSNNINNNRNKVQNALPIQSNNNNKTLKEKNNLSNNNKKTGVTSIRFGTNQPHFKSNSISGNNNINNNNKNNNKKVQQPIKVNENLIKGKLIENIEEDNNNIKKGLGIKQSKPIFNAKFGEKNSSKTNILNSTSSSNALRDTKSSFKFNPSFENTNNKKLINNYYNNPIKINNSNVKKINNKPFGKFNFDDGDFLPDDVDFGGNFDDEKEIQEAIQRSLWQK